MENDVQHTSVTPRDFTFHLLEQITNKFSKDRIVGRGGYGVVYKGVLDNGEEVAVKKLYNKHQGVDDDKQFTNECTNLMRLQHQNIVRLVGYCYEIAHKVVEYNGQYVCAGVEERALCFEYLHGGTLEKLLSDESCGLNWHTRYKIIRGVCEGLHYLHNGSKDPIYHLDLKPANIMLDKNMIPKIGDFGLSRLFDSTQTCTTRGIIGTPGYMPPEYINRYQITSKFDVFSLGIVIIQVMAGREGYLKYGKMPSQEFINLVHENWTKRFQATISVLTSHEIKTCIEIALRCVEIDRVKRPTIREIVAELDRIDSEKRSLIHQVNLKCKEAFNMNSGAADAEGALTVDHRDDGNKEQEHMTLDKIPEDDPSDTLSESRGQYDCLLSDHDHLLQKRDRAVREVEVEGLHQKMYYEFSTSELESASENFSSSLKIGEGGFACVYRGILRNTTVAIKVLRPDSLQGRSQFEHEIAILSRVRHPHLVTLLGACSESSTLVYEFLPNGSLEDFLVSADTRQTLIWQTRVRIITEICSALTFLHKNKPHPVVHGDLKPANILLGVNLVSKLSDFGISRLLIQCSTNNTALYRTIHPAGTPLYMDPEFLATGELTTHSDVYSFGIVVLRLLTGKPPAGIKKIVEDAIMKGELHSVVDSSAGEWPDAIVVQLAHLALSCTELSRRCRPDLSGEVWRVVHAMRDAASITSTSSSRSVSDENCTPPYFICPIYKDIMNDPQIAADGFTYEAEAIRSWLVRGHGTSPMTNMRLENDELIPNRALRSAIQEWRHHQQNLA